MGKLLFSINSYLDELSGLGYDVPTSAELAEALGLHPTSMSRLANNRQAGPSREQIEAIITFFRGRGIKTTPNDLLRWVDR